MSDYQIIEPRDDFKQSVRYFLVVNIVLISTTILFWIFTGFSLASFLLSLLSLILFIILTRRLNELEKSLAVLPSSLETTNRKNAEIIDFDQIIQIKIQYEQFTPGFFVFHPITLISSILRNIQGKNALSTRLAYEIETETYMIYDIISYLDYEEINKFIEILHTNSGIEPMIKDYRTIFGAGTVLLFSFKGRHSDLDPDEVSGLL